MKQKKGVALIWAMVTSTVLLIVSSTMANYIFKESGMSLRIDNSISAYSAAKSGIEWGRYCVENIELTDKSCGFSIPASPGVTKGPFIIEETTSTSIPNTTYSVTFTDLGSNKYKIESIGEANGVRRKIEHTATKDAWKNVEFTGGAYPALTSNGSFAQQFDFWLGSATTSDFKIGVGSATSNIALKYVASSKKIYLASDYGGVEKTSSDSIDLSSQAANLTNDYFLQARIEYVNGYSARLIVSTRDSVQKLSCFGSIILNIAELNRVSGWFPSNPIIYGSGAFSEHIIDPVTGQKAVKMTVATDSVLIGNMAVKNLLP